MQDDFEISQGETLGSRQITFYYCQKVTLEDIHRMIEREFPNTEPKDIYFLPTFGCTISTGNTFEVKSS